MNTTVETTTEAAWAYMGGCPCLSRPAAEPELQERRIEARESELRLSEILFSALAGGGKSTLPMAKAKDYQRNGVFANNEGLSSIC